MSDSEVSLTQPYKPKQLLEGVSLEQVRSLPKVKALLERLAEESRVEGRKSGYDAGFSAGFKEGAEKANLESEKELNDKLNSVDEQLVEIVQQLKRPVAQLSEQVLLDLKLVFNKCVKSLVSDASIYDDSLSKSVVALLETLPSNNQLVSISLSNKVTPHFVGYFEQLGVSVELVEMSDLIRVVTTAGNFRFDPKDFCQSVLGG